MMYQYIVLHQSVRNHPGVAAVQAAHAAGESCFAGPAPYDCYVVALMAPTSKDLEDAAVKLTEAGIRHKVVYEPDPPYYGAATAIGVEPTPDREKVRALLSHFALLR